MATLWPVLIAEGIDFSPPGAAQNVELSAIGGQLAKLLGVFPNASRRDRLGITVS